MQYRKRIQSRFIVTLTEQQSAKTKKTLKHKKLNPFTVLAVVCWRVVRFYFVCAVGTTAMPKMFGKMKYPNDHVL